MSTKTRKRDKYHKRGLESDDDDNDDGKFTFEQIEEVVRDLLPPTIRELRLFGMYCGLPYVDNLGLLLDNKAEFCPDLKLLIVEIWDVALAEDVRIPTQIMKLCERNDIECIILGNRSGKFLRPHSPGLTPWEGLGKVRSDWRTLLEM
ncbi:DNA repair and recombination protein RAD54B [Elsinoe australis]|uniref:DNA repair and recombination protein RAD54B n=1 Tax=Elsinoe australis TaxID=40998 RepID=A0A2P7Z452_9PEZI|nr:DNA repair and recombination protein RAD54B [Elsinoe australis]